MLYTMTQSNLMAVAVFVLLVQVASAVRNRAPEMVESLYTMNRVCFGFSFMFRAMMTSSQYIIFTKPHLTTDNLSLL